MSTQTKPTGTKPTGTKSDKTMKPKKPKIIVAYFPNGLPVTKDSTGNLIRGITKADFFAHLPSKEDKSHSQRKMFIKKALLEYAADVADQRAKSFGKKADPKEKARAKKAKLLEQIEEQEAIING